jgi:D-galactarolactone cycloisomerase
MKITDVLIHPLSQEMTDACWSAHEVFARQQLILVEIRTDQGLIGVGEIWFGPQDVVVDYLKLFAPLIKGMDARGIPQISERLLSTTRPRPGGIGGWDGLPAPLPRHHRPMITAAIAGIDNALWDLKGKAANLPIFRLLGGTRTQVHVYATGGFYVIGEEPSYYAKMFEGFVKHGYKSVKLKAGALSLQEEVARVRAVRDAIGPDVELLLDLNQPFDVAQCLRYAEAVAPYDILWLEEPLYWYLQPEDFSALARECPIPLANGEREMHRYSSRDFIDSGAIKYIQFDSVRHMGFSEALKIAEHAALKNVIVAPHASPHYHGHLVSALGEAAYAAEYMGTEHLHPVHNAIYQSDNRVRNGVMNLSDAPGWGITVDWKEVEKFRV